MPYFTDPAVPLNFAPLVSLAETPGFLNNPGSSYAEEVDDVLYAASLAGYNTNPLGPIQRRGYTVDWLADSLSSLAETQNPDLGLGLRNANQTVDTIVSRANKAAQMASIPLALRSIGGLVLQAMQRCKIDLTDEAIARISPDDKGIRVVKGSNLEYSAAMSLRELANTEIDKANKWSIDPALLVRESRFGAVAAGFESNLGTVSFAAQQSPYPGTITIAINSAVGRQTKEFIYHRGNQVPPYSLSKVPENNGSQLTAIQQASAELLRLYGLTYDARQTIDELIAHRYTLPNPNERPGPITPQIKRKRWSLWGR